MLTPKEYAEQAKTVFYSLRVKNQKDAIETHETVGKEVRRKIDGTMPEDILPAEPIKIVRKRLKKGSDLQLVNKNKRQKNLKK